MTSVGQFMSVLGVGAAETVEHKPGVRQVPRPLALARPVTLTRGQGSVPPSGSNPLRETALIPSAL